MSVESKEEVEQKTSPRSIVSRGVRYNCDQCTKIKISLNYEL